MIHVVSPYRGRGPLANRQRLFFESVAAADRGPAKLLAITGEGWAEPGWEIEAPGRDARAVGDASDKPFLLDLFDAAFQYARTEDWLLYSNVDCCFAADLYTHLCRLRGVVVEFMRQDVDGDPQTLAEVFGNPRESQKHGLDAMAIRASYYAEVRGLLYNFVVGEPHWDTAYSTLFRDRIPVHRDSVRLFHPKHEQVWDLSHPTPAGKHNHHLFKDAMLHSVAEKTMIEETRTSTDTAVIIGIFGGDPLRRAAHELALRNQLRQDLLADVYVVEMLLAGEESGVPESLRDEVQCVRIPADDSHLDLFQKEAIWNYGWRHAAERGNYDYYLFLDADVFATDLSWHRAIRERLRGNPARAVQCFDVVVDTVDEQYRMSGIAATFLCNRPNDLTVNPGIGWGLHRLLLEMGNGFNARSIGHAGDSLFVCEYLNTPDVQYDPYLADYDWYFEVLRELPFRAEMDFVPYTLSHAYHGPVLQRDMKWLRVAMDGLGPTRDWLQLDANGMQQWINPAGVERRIVAQRARFVSEESVAEVFAEHGLARRVRAQAARPATAGVRPVFAAPGWIAPADFETVAGEPESGAGDPRFHVFDPTAIFRDNYPFSWCDGVARRAGSTHVPMRIADGEPTLILEATPDATWFLAVLAVEANWAPQDLTGMERLTFWYWLEGVASVGLMSAAVNGIEPSTDEVPLTGGGDTVLPMTAFVPQPGFDLSRVRLIKFAGQAGTRLHLRRIRIE